MHAGMTMPCPRCGLPLKPVTYEGVPVDWCPECWGYWLDRGEFKKIALSRELVFTKEERERALWGAAKARQPSGAGDAPISCPRCGKTMAKVDFNLDAPVTLDRCPDHGIWFDTRELKLAQILAEEAAAIRKLFFEKLHE